MGDMNWATELESHVERLMAADQLPGAGIGLAHNGKQVYGRGFGYRDREQGLPVTPDTVFGIGSVTKSFTCVAIMQLQEAGGFLSTIRSFVTSRNTRLATKRTQRRRRFTTS